jgi:glycerol-3-phosphate dehydrogenase
MAESEASRDPTYDVAVIGAGVVGCAIARALSRHRLRVALVEAGNDVGTGISKANSAILHTGFDARPGTLEARLVSRGHRLLNEYAASAGIPMHRVGATLVAWPSDDSDALERISSRAVENGYHAAERLTADQVYRREPHLAPGAVGGLAIPDESIICPFTTPLAFATEAVANGTTLMLDSPVETARRVDRRWELILGGTRISTAWVINAAGLHGDSVAGLFGASSPEIRPRRGQFVVFDKTAGGLVSSIVLGVPSPRSKGVLLAPTVFGNLLLGPTSEDVDAKDATETTEDGIAHLLEKGTALLPGLADTEVTSTYAGLRAVPSTDAYHIEVDAGSGYGCATGIRSTGLSASMAIAEYLLDQLSDAGLALETKAGTVPSIISSAADSADGDAGRVVCFCELTTMAELEKAAVSPIPPRTVDGVWRRTRATGGRCQGFYCRAQVVDWLAAKTGRTAADLLEVGQA